MAAENKYGGVEYKDWGKYLYETSSGTLDSEIDEDHVGFYYDNQQENPYLTMSLHPSTYQVGTGWKNYSEGFPAFGGGGVVYSYAPIAVAFLSEDPSFAIGNRYTDFNGGNPIEGLFNSAKPYGALASKWIEPLEEAIKQGEGENLGGSLAGLANGALKLVKQGAEIANKYLNKNLIVQGTRFSYYSGTDFSANSLEFKFIKFSDYDKNGKFHSVTDYLRHTLFPYCSGIYTSAGGSSNIDPGKHDTPPIGYVEKFIANYCGFQTPPGGFEMKADSLDKAIKGTLRLNVGGMYAIENLVIKSVNFNLSRVQAKNPASEGETVPLYAEISLMLAPASMLTNQSFYKMVDPKENSLGAVKTAREKHYQSMMNKRKSQITGKRKAILSTDYHK